MSELIKKEKMTFDKLKSDFERIGFKVNGNLFKKVVTVGVNTMVVNGRKIEQPQQQILRMVYTGEGGIVENDGSEEIITEPLFFFDLIDEHGEVSESFSLYDISDFYSLFNIR